MKQTVKCQLQLFIQKEERNQHIGNLLMPLASPCTFHDLIAEFNKRKSVIPRFQKFEELLSEKPLEILVCVKGEIFYVYWHDKVSDLYDENNDNIIFLFGLSSDNVTYDNNNNNNNNNNESNESEPKIGPLSTNLKKRTRDFDNDFGSNQQVFCHEYHIRDDESLGWHSLPPVEDNAGCYENV